MKKDKEQQPRYSFLCYGVDLCWLFYVCAMCVLSRSVVSRSLQPHGLQLTRLLGPWNFPGKNSEVGCYFLLQGIFQTQGLNSRLLCLLHQQVDSLPPGKLYFIYSSVYIWGFPRGSGGKEFACSVEDLGSIPGLGRSPGEGKGYPSQLFWPGEFYGLYRVGHD